MHKSLLVLSTAALALTALPVAADSPADASSRTFALVRTTEGPASFRLLVDGQFTEQAPSGFSGYISARVEGGRVVRAAALGATTYGYDDGVTLKAREDEISVCEPIGGCIVNRTLAYNTGTTSSDAGEPGADNLLLVALEGPADVRFEGSGWELRPLRLNYRYVRADDAQAAGVFTAGNSIEVFEHAQAPGGQGGSIGVGTPPCSDSVISAGVPIPKGLGTATLTGGAAKRTTTCPANVGRPFLTDIAATTTSWALTGPVVGDADGRNVPLFVVDLPAAECLTVEQPPARCLAG